MSSQKYSGRIAVVGMSVQYAGSRDLDEFWSSLSKNEIKTGPISSQRLGSNKKSMHYVDARPKYADTFNNDRYGVINTDGGPLDGLDNEHDLLLKLTLDALADMDNRNTSTAKPSKFDMRKFGIISGCLSFPSDRLQGEMLNLYQSHLEPELTKILNAKVLDPAQVTVPWTTARDPSSDNDPKDKRFYMDPATFVASELGLGGVRYSVDAACASALYVLKLAQDYLLREDSQVDAILCGGVCFPEPFFILTGFSCFHAMPLRDGISMPLRKKSEGLTPGEGGAIMVLKRYEDAIRDGDHIYGSLLSVRLNNAGDGLPLAPHQASQRACLAECYKNIGLNPHMVQYVECHATGTPMGDVSECEAMRHVFEGRVPRFGSTKGNFGHTLVAAGFAGMAKVLLAMNKSTIPPTPGVDSTTVVDPKVVVLESEPWPDVSDGRLKRAGLSAFGFGGTNAHAVFEEPKGGITAPPLPLPIAKARCPVAVIGMSACFGALRSLDEFERALYSGGDGSCDLPPKRWRFLSRDESFASGLSNGTSNKPPRGCYVGDIDVDYKRIKTTLVLEDQLLPQQLLALSTIDKAIQDSNLPKGGRVAVLVGLGTDLELYRHRARVALRERLAEGVLKDRESESKLMDYVHDKGTSTSYTSYIGNLVATRISSQWKFTGPSFTVTEGANSVFRCLEMAQIMLASGDCDAAVVAGVDMNASAEAVYVHSRRTPLDGASTPTAPFERSSGGYFPGEGAGALVLKRMSDVNGDRVYCAVDAVACSDEVIGAAQNALNVANCAPQDVDLLELSAETVQLADSELRGLGIVYSTSSSSTRRTQCVGTAKANVGHTGYASGAASLIRTALCLYNRYYPATPRWEEPKDLDLWTAGPASSFYVSPESKPWFKNKGQLRRAAVSGLCEAGSAFHVLLRDVDHQTESRLAFDPTAPKLLVLHGVTADVICDRIEQTLLPQLTSKSNEDPSLPNSAATSVMRALMAETRDASVQNVSGAVVCVVTNQLKLARELELVARGVRKAASEGRPWFSPTGSCFTPKPLADPRVVFIYGDGAAPYPGLGRELWRAIPTMHEVVDNLTQEMWKVPDDAWNPRCVTLEEFKAQSQGFLLNQVEMFRSGVFHSVLFTYAATELMGIKPAAACGLSLGEISMLFAFSPDNSRKSEILTDRLTSSPVWNEELAGPMNVLRRAWGVSADVPTKDFWSGYVVRGTRAEVEAAISSADVKHVRLLIVNDDKTVLIAGFPTECAAVALKLGKGPGVFVAQGMCGHCPESVSQSPGIEQIYEHVCRPACQDVKLFSSLTLKPLEGKAGDPMHNFVSSVYTTVADFPRTVLGVVKNSGGNVFVEVGPNGHRAAAVDSILANQPHIAVALDKQGKTTWEMIMRATAVLMANKVPGVSVRAFYASESVEPIPAPNPLTRNVVVNGRWNGLAQSDISPNLLAILGPATSIPQPKSPFDRRPARAGTTPKAPDRLTPRLTPVKTIIPGTVQSRILPSSNSEAATGLGSSALSGKVQIAEKNGTNGMHLVNGTLPSFSSPQGTHLTPVPPGLSNQLISDNPSRFMDWHPLFSTLSPEHRLTFTPTNFKPRNVCFLPFNPDQDAGKHAPGTFPLTWVNLAEFMCGKVSRCLGPEFARFDVSKTSRSPAYDLQLLTRVLGVNGMEHGGNWYGVDVNPAKGSTIAEFDCPASAWFYKGSSNDGYMPYSILMEIALQTSGVLTSVLKAPLTMNKDDILFRNLDATTETKKVVDLRDKTIVNKTHCTGYSMMGTMGIHRFHFELFVKGDAQPFYVGDTSFGWFTPEVFENQVGLDAGQRRDPWHLVEGSKTYSASDLIKIDLTSEADRIKLFAHVPTGAKLGRRSAQCEFLDSIEILEKGGKYGKGYVRGTKRVVKDDWFFSCHFWNDPVMPGSLGIESMVQAAEHFSVFTEIAQRFGLGGNVIFNQASGATAWKYRGQLTPKNDRMDCEIHIKSVELDAFSDGVIVAFDGFLYVDRLRVYAATDLRVRLSSSSSSVAAPTPSHVLKASSPTASPQQLTGPVTTAALKAKILKLDEPVYLSQNGTMFASGPGVGVEEIPALLPRDLGDPTFMSTYGVDYPLYTGAMAKGIASADLVIQNGKAKILASLGAGGLPIHSIRKNLDKIQAELPNGPFMVNLIHSPFNENLERGCVDLLLERGVRFVEASAFMNLTPQVVRYRVKGLERGPDGSVVVKNRVIAKISRTELAEMFVRPAPDSILDKLLANAEISQEQRDLAKRVPMCDDIAVEADSGGHTDNRPMTVILPMIIAVRDRLHKECGFPRHLRVRVGAGGGIGNPAAVLAAFQMGAAFVVTGTINQMSKQSGSSDIVRGQLSKATYSDITMAPAADMFDQGVQLQVLKKGTMFAARAKKLYELFVRYESLDEIPTEEREKLEKQVFRKRLDTVWTETVSYYVEVLKDQAKIDQAYKDPKLKMSLVFRWYLGLSSTWANTGVADRAMDYQVWCGPAIGAFNEFIRGSYLDPVVAKAYPDVDQINKQVFRGACYVKRVRLIQSNKRLSAVDTFDVELTEYKPSGVI